MPSESSDARTPDTHGSAPIAALYSARMNTPKVPLRVMPSPVNPGWRSRAGWRCALWQAHRRHRLGQGAASSTPRSSSPPGRRPRASSGRSGHSYIWRWPWRPGWSGGNAVWRARAARWACSSLQLALNALWSWLFFGWHRGALAFADIVVLLALIVATIVAFAQHTHGWPPGCSRRISRGWASRRCSATPCGSEILLLL